MNSVETKYPSIILSTFPKNMGDKESKDNPDINFITPLFSFLESFIVFALRLRVFLSLNKRKSTENR